MRPAALNGLLVAFGGALGALLRYHLGLWVLALMPAARFPWATWLVNVLGCLAVGAVWAWSLRFQAMPEGLRLALMIGLLGGFTTFSAFGLETVAMLKRGDIGLASIYVLSSLLLGLMAVWAGWSLVERGLA